MRIEMEQPHLYRHPDPFNTNPFWSEEIAMGPQLPKKKGKDSSRNASQSQRELTSAGTQSITTRTSSAAEISNPDATGPNPAEARVDAATTTPHPTTLQPQATRSTPTVVLEDTASEMTEDWNHKRYQREDEELWGHENFSRTGQRLMDAIKHAGSSAGRYMETKLGMAGGERQVTEEDRFNFYTPPEPKNPPVNEYHPPIVRNKPAHKDGYQWMLQPPPSAKVMEGKVPVSRSASRTSTQSRRAPAPADNNSLGRLVGEKSVEARRRKGEPQARPPYARTKSQRTTRSRSVSGSGGSDISEGRPASQRRLRASQVANAMDSSDEEADYAPLSFEASRNVAGAGHAAQRPRLETIMSSDLTGKSASAGLDAVVPANALREAQNGGSVPPAAKEQRPSGASIDSGLALHA